MRVGWVLGKKLIRTHKSGHVRVVASWVLWGKLVIHKSGRRGARVERLTIACPERFNG